MVKRDYHTDVGPILDYPEFHSETLHEIPHGNEFPASPSERDRYYRDDLNQEYYYNGTDWISTGFHADEHSIGGDDPLKITYQIRYRLDNRVTEPTPYTGKVGAPFYRTDIERVKVVANETESKELAWREDCTWTYAASGEWSFSTTEANLFTPITTEIGMYIKINLSEMVAGDAVRVQVQSLTKSGGSYNREFDRTYYDAQDNPVVVDLDGPFFGVWGIRVRIQLTDGTVGTKVAEWVRFKDR